MIKNNYSKKIKAARKDYHCMFYTDIDGYDKNKIVGMRKDKYFKGSFSKFYPTYKYSEMASKDLTIKTDFLPMKKDPYFRIPDSVDQFFLDINSPELFELKSFLYSLDKHIESLNTDPSKMDSFFGNDIILKKFYGILRSKNNVSLNSDVNAIKLKLKKNSQGQIASKVINYNISKLYPKTEEITSFPELKKKFKKDKECRYVIKPAIWINYDSSSFGVKLIVDSMEIKYPNQHIVSELDNMTMEFEPKKTRNIEIKI